MLVIYQRALRRFTENREEYTAADEKTALSAHRNTLRGDAKKRVFHLPGCEHYHCRHCTLEFKDVHVAREAGFAPCEICRDRIDE